MDNYVIFINRGRDVIITLQDDRYYREHYDYDTGLETVWMAAIMGSVVWNGKSYITNNHDLRNNFKPILF